MVLHNKKAVVLLSGGLDSATALYWAISKGYHCACLNVHYGQRHSKEAQSARAISGRAGCVLKEVRLPMDWLRVSSLVDAKKMLPNVPIHKIANGSVPSTYVPARNTVFLSLALSLAESSGAKAVVIGANALDYSGYPDCRPEYFRAFQEVARLGTRSGVQGQPIRILSPLERLNKAQIVRLARNLEVPIEWTWSCYLGAKRPCGRCDSCKLRAKGFCEAGIPDPAFARSA